MPRYFFDVKTALGTLRDDEGAVLFDLKRAVMEAKRTLAQMCFEAFADAESGGLVIDIRGVDSDRILVSVFMSGATVPSDLATVQSRLGS